MQKFLGAAAKMFGLEQKLGITVLLATLRWLQ
jgi:hypothetical protein